MAASDTVEMRRVTVAGITIDDLVVVPAGRPLESIMDDLTSIRDANFFKEVTREVYDYSPKSPSLEILAPFYERMLQPLGTVSVRISGLTGRPKPKADKDGKHVPLDIEYEMDNMARKLAVYSLAENFGTAPGRIAKSNERLGLLVPYSSASLAPYSPANRSREEPNAVILRNGDKNSKFARDEFTLLVPYADEGKVSTAMRAASAEFDRHVRHFPSTYAANFPSRYSEHRHAAPSLDYGVAIGSSVKELVKQARYDMLKRK